ncbi:MAG: hypothetical protein LYZ70_00550 [Nitrososphaerales archaeon]|nr:hypothetical protein [Nitrososphaerales archaeon]
MKYEVRLSKRALKELGSLDSITEKGVVSKLEEMEEDPFPRGAVKLQGREGLY